MALQIIQGPSGSGKSHITYGEVIRESVEHPERNFLVLVPEQFTMRTQDDLSRMHPRGGLLNIDVLSFNRLAHRVFEEVGGNTRPILDDTGKSLVVQKVISQKKDELGTLRRALSRRGAAEQMKSLISEFLQYRVAPDDLDSWIADFSRRGLLAEKLKDIQTIYRGFADYLADRYLTTEELLQVLCAVLSESGFLRGATVLMDGFTGFTPIQYEVIRELLKTAAEVRVVITADEETDLLQKGGAHRLFHMSHQTAEHLVNLAREAGAEILPVRRLAAGEKSRHHTNPELAFLEKNIFRSRQKKYEAEPENIFLTEAADPADELQRAAEIISRRVRREGLRYSDFALVTGDLGTYGRLGSQIFSEAGIPHFLDSKQPVWMNALVELVRAALDLLAHRHSYASVIRYLRCPFSGFTKEEIDRLENYVLALGIRGRSQYEQKWIRTSKRIDDREVAVIEETRARFVAQTSRFTEEMRKATTVAGKAEALYRFLFERELQARCQEEEERFKEAGDEITAREYAQIYPRTIDLLDKLVEVLGDEKTTMADFQQLIEAGFAELRLGLIPPGEDQVLIGDIERTRLTNIKVLFFVGVNEGIIPRPVSDAGILSEPDRLLLSQADIALAPTAREEIARQRFYLYLNMTKASDALYLSYSTSDASGSARGPSYLIGTIRRLFPEAKVCLLSADRTEADLAETPQGREQILLAGLRGNGEETAAFRELCRHLEKTEEGSEKLDRVFGAASTEKTSRALGAKLARELYGELLVNSATRLEKFAACPFAHFANYGLRLKEREQYDFTPADFGTLLHDALERFSDKIRDEKLSWANLDEEKRDALADEALEDIAHSYRNEILSSSQRNLFLIERIRRMLKKTVWVLQKQLEKGEFENSAAEEDFLEADRTMELPEGMRMQLGGRIDRLDVCETDDSRLIKVIDYKTGNTKLDLNFVLEGLQLQLALYLNAAMAKEGRAHPDKKIEPAGMFYYHVNDPVLKDVPVEETEADLLRELRPEGLVRGEEEILRLLDRELAPGKGSDVLRVKLKNDGTPDAYSRTANRETFDLVQSYAERKAQALALEIAEGKVAAEPYRSKERNACAWCEFRDLCGFDERIPGCSFRRVPERDEEEIFEAMALQVNAAKGAKAKGAETKGDSKETGEKP